MITWLHCFESLVKAEYHGRSTPMGKERCFCYSFQELKRQEKALKVFIFVFIVDIFVCTLCDP